MKTKRLWLKIGLAAAAAVLLSAMTYAVLLHVPSENETTEPMSTMVLRTTAAAHSTARPVKRGKSEGVAIPGWSSIDLPAGTTEADVQLYNPTDNEDKYNLVFELRLKDTGEVLFTTGMVVPGMYCSRVTLTRELEKGIYEGVMHVQPVRVGDQSLTNNADISITINVE